MKPSLELQQGAVLLEAEDAGISHYFGPASFAPNQSSVLASEFLLAADDTLRIETNLSEGIFKLNWLSRFNVSGYDGCKCTVNEND